MSLANEALARRVVDEIWNGGNLDLIEELYAEDFVCHVEPEDDWVGRAGVRDAVNLVRGTLSDYEERIDDVVVDGDKVALRIMVTGTYDASGSADDGASGRRVSTLAVLIYRVADGQIAEQWEVVNMLGMFRQLGFESIT